MAPTPALSPGKSHGRRSLEGCSPWGRWGSGTTERLHFPFSLSCIGEGNGNPLQCSCLENPRDGGGWWTALYGVAQSQTWLKWLSSSSRSLYSLFSQDNWPERLILTSSVSPCSICQGQMDKVKHIHPMKYYSAVKKNRVLTHALSWVNREDTVLSERKQTQKAMCCMIPFMWDVQNRIYIKVRKSMSGCQRLGGEAKGEWLLSRCRISFWDDENDLEQNSGKRLQRCCERTTYHWTAHFPFLFLTVLQGMWDLKPPNGIKPVPPTVEAQS